MTKNMKRNVKVSKIDELETRQNDPNDDPVGDTMSNDEDDSGEATYEQIIAKKPVNKSEIKTLMEKYAETDEIIAAAARVVQVRSDLVQQIAAIVGEGKKIKYNGNEVTVTKRKNKGRPGFKYYFKSDKVDQDVINLEE